MVVAGSFLIMRALSVPALWSWRHFRMGMRLVLLGWLTFARNATIETAGRFGLVSFPVRGGFFSSEGGFSTQELSAEGKSLPYTFQIVLLDRSVGRFPSKKGRGRKRETKGHRASFGHGF